MSGVADAGLRAGDELALERAFAHIQATRMAGLEFLNPALRVEALGFRDWSGLRLGVLVTPWSINLVLLPGPVTLLPPVRVGDQKLWTFPSGIYGFYAHEEAATGPYQQCSLFSPVAEFASQEDAVAAARAALAALLEVPPPPAPEPPATLSRRGLFGAA